MTNRQLLCQELESLSKEDILQIVSMSRLSDPAIDALLAGIQRLRDSRRPEGEREKTDVLIPVLDELLIIYQFLGPRTAAKFAMTAQSYQQAFNFCRKSLCIEDDAWRRWVLSGNISKIIDDKNLQVLDLDHIIKDIRILVGERFDDVVGDTLSKQIFQKVMRFDWLHKKMASLCYQVFDNHQERFLSALRFKFMEVFSEEFHNLSESEDEVKSMFVPRMRMLSFVVELCALGVLRKFQIVNLIISFQNHYQVFEKLHSLQFLMKIISKITVIDFDRRFEDAVLGSMYNFFRFRVDEDALSDIERRDRQCWLARGQFHRHGSIENLSRELQARAI